jgi:hypothetical protein
LMVWLPICGQQPSNDAEAAHPVGLNAEAIMTFS